MAEGFGIKGTPGVQSSLPGSQAAESVSNLPKAPAKQAPATNSTQATTFTSDPAVSTQVHSKVVSRLLDQGATIYGPGLARVPLPGRPEGTPRAVPKKPAGPMVPARDLQAGHSPLAPTALADARASLDALGELPSAGGQDAEAYWSGRLDALDAFLGESA